MIKLKYNDNISISYVKDARVCYAIGKFNELEEKIIVGNKHVVVVLDDKVFHNVGCINNLDTKESWSWDGLWKLETLFES